MLLYREIGALDFMKPEQSTPRKSPARPSDWPMAVLCDRFMPIGPPACKRGRISWSASIGRKYLSDTLAGLVALR